ncbi:hypothetical protein AB4Y30_01230 [Ornithinibacillus sp. 4-3]|uniref:Beta-carotene 15,15'-monooxygenase n=1 Tax=Ornithinibacillus sp. 4-3 TaxID=3231488 RepID=A0AB39HL30_9BACI
MRKIIPKEGINIKGNRLQIPILLMILSIVIISSYIILRLNNVSSLVVILLTLALMILCPLSIYFFWIRPRAMPKLLVYLSFILCLGITYVIIPTSQKAFLNQMLVWIIPILEVSIFIFVVYSIVKSIIRYKRINLNKRYNFLEVIRKALEPKLGNGFVLEAILTEVSVFYYAVLVWFKKTKKQESGAYTYHKTSQIKTVIIVFSILLAIEGVALHFIIQLWSTIAAWIFTVLNVYALFYMVGLYNSTKFLPHIIHRDKLIVRLGYQSSIELDIRNIETIKTAQAQGGIGEKIPKTTYYSLLNMDTPHYEILLEEPVLMKGAYGRKRHVNTVVFRADKPNEMIDQINLMKNQFSDEKQD